MALGRGLDLQPGHAAAAAPAPARGRRRRRRRSGHGGGAEGLDGHVAATGGWDGWMDGGLRGVENVCENDWNLIMKVLYMDILMGLYGFIGIVLRYVLGW